MPSKIETILKLAKRRRPNAAEKVPLRDEDGNDISRVEGVDGQLYLEMWEADLPQKEAMFAIATQGLRGGGAGLPASALLRFLLDEKLLRDFRFPVVEDDGRTISVICMPPGPLDVGLTMDLINQNLSFRLAACMVKSISDWYGWGEETPEVKVINEAKNLPASSESEDAKV